MTKVLIAVFLASVTSFDKDMEHDYNALLKHKRFDFMELCTLADSTLAEVSKMQTKTCAPSLVQLLQLLVHFWFSFGSVWFSCG